jgi:hypothetical protein
MKQTLSLEDLLTRAPVWEVLASFWLDTELLEQELDHIARIIAESPYTLEEVQTIHRYEVAPAVSANLLGIAGEWSEFDSDWLNARCAQFASRRHSIWFRTRIWLQIPLINFFTSKYWRQVIPRVVSLRLSQRK